MQRLPLLGRYRRRSRHPTRPARQRRVADQDGVNRFLASPDGSGRQVDDRFAALGFAGPTKAPPLATTVAPREWLVLVDVRGTEFDRDTTNDLNGTQVNAIGGVTRRLTPDLLVGVLGGYEHFDYSSQALAGTLKGDGWTAGGFVGWRFAPNLRFDAAGAWSDILPTTQPAAPRASSRATAGWSPVASPAPMAGRLGCLNPRRGSMPFGNTTTPSPTVSGRRNRPRISPPAASARASRRAIRSRGRAP